MALVRLSGVSKVYRSMQGKDYVAVRDFDLEIEAGEFVCLLGTSGCGKTTVLNLVAGFERASAGTIEIGGRAIDGPGADRGVVFQGDDSLYSWLTATGNVEFGMRMRGIARTDRKARAQRYLELVGLTGQGGKHPPELSGGMKQRIQIARVLANEPEILLMDEPFGALDAQTRAVMQQELLKIWRSTGKTVLFITHDIDEAITLATRIGVMQAGPASKLKGIIPVELGDQERDRTADAFVAVYRQVHALIREELEIAMRAVGMTLGERGRVILGYAIGFASMFVLWHLAAVYVVSSVLFPPPWRVLVKAYELADDGMLGEQVEVSMQRILIGFVCGSAIGIPVGLAIGSFATVRRVLEPYTEFFRFIPATAMITVAVIWFGIGEGSKIFLIIYTTVFVVIVNTAAGVGAVARNKIRAAQSLGASRSQIFLFVALPATVPYILTGMRAAMGNSFITIIAAELIAANAGLGKMIWDARLFMLVDQIFVALMTLGLLGFVTDRLFRWAIYAFAGRYSPVT